jgi:DNA invertase Pin-like site-specific DNA recombinase
MRIGYARVSTDDQTLDLQLDALNRAKCRQIYKEQASGKNAVRPELDACLKSLRKGDTLVVWRLDRLGRSLGDLIQLTNELKSRNVEFESLTEKVETGSPTQKQLFDKMWQLPDIEDQAQPRPSGEGVGTSDASASAEHHAGRGL